MPDTETVTETWTALGTRVSSDGKRMQAWLDPVDNITRYWTERGGYIVGGQYELEIHREPPANGHEHGSVVRHGKPVYRTRPHDERRAEWEIAEESAERKLRAAAAERRDRKQGKVLDEACQPLCEIAARLRHYEDVERLISSVRARLMDAWDRQ